MPKHKTRNAFYWITWEVNTICWWSQKEKNIKKIYKNYNLKTTSRPFCICKGLGTTSIGKCNLWITLHIIRYVIAKLSKFVQISMQASSHFFLQRIFWPTGQISLTGFVYFPSYSVKCVSCFMLRYLMTLWQLNISKINIWLSQERKELSKWNKKAFPCFTSLL